MGVNLSSLFSGLGGSSSDFGSSNWLSDYRSIKNGSYGKLMKAYYSETGSSAVGSTSSSKKTAGTSDVVDKILAEKKKVKVESKESKAYTAVKSASDSLVNAVEKLRATDESSVFAKKNITTIDENGLESTEFGYDKEAIYNAVNDYVKAYNTLLSATAGVNSSSVANRVADMQKDTTTNKQALEQLGITVNADNTLSINKDNFMKMDMERVENLFGDKGYYTFGVAETAGMIKYNANYEQLRGNTYTDAGAYNTATTVGTTYNSSF